MNQRFSIEALDLTLQYLLGNTKVMGDEVVLSSGDFRQYGPLIQFGGPAESVDAYLEPTSVVQRETSETRFIRT
ncbi:unnamed protein product [Scytosiphon promiscuus]